MKPLSTWTPAELRDELGRIDRMRLPLSGATMMRRNELANELATRPQPRQMSAEAADFLDALRTGRTIRGIGRDRYEQSIQPPVAR